MLSIFFTLLGLFPTMAALGLLSPENSEPETQKLLASRLERAFAAVFFLGAAALWFSRRPKGVRNKRERTIDFVCVLMPLLVLSGHLFVHSAQAYKGLYLGDHDFTNMSAALNRTAKGEGLLRTPFLATGEKGGYLGHHFAPALLLYVPFYAASHLFPDAAAALLRVAGGFDAGYRFPTHFLYAALLWLTQLAGLVLWALFIGRRVKDPFLAVACAGIVAFSVPLWRLSQSFHFEILVLPLSAALFLTAKAKKPWLFFLFASLWLAVKEDMSVYLFFYALHLACSGRSLRRRGGVLAVVCVAYVFAATGPLRDYFAGGTAVDWQGYWSDAWGTERRAGPAFYMLASFAFLPVLRIRLFLLTIVPILAMHCMSYHPWHGTFYGHYSYSVLPFLLLGFTEGFVVAVRKARRWRMRGVQVPVSLCVSIALYVASGDRETPAANIPPDPRYEAASALARSLPANSCLQTQIPFTSQTPLRLRVFPLAIPRENPMFALLPPPGSRGGEPPRVPGCGRDYLLLDLGDPRPPYYDEKTLEDFDRHAREAMNVEGGDGVLLLYAYPERR